MRAHDACRQNEDPMRLTGTKAALSAAVTRSIYRPGGRDVMRAFKPGCSFHQQSGTRQPD
jgi:hypothetical protein